MNNDDDLRQLFRDATSDIRPRGTLDDIRTQTKKVDPMARRWFLPSMAAAAVMALVIGGAFWMTRDDSAPDRPNVATSPTSPPASATPAVMADATVFYVGEGARGPRLYAETHSVQVKTAAPLAAVQEAALGVPLDPDYKSYWPSTITIESTSFDGVGDSGGIGIRLSAAVPDVPNGTSAKQARMQVEAIVRTAQAAFSGTNPVEFYVDGERQESVLGVAGPSFTGGSDDDVLALVQISNLTDGTTVKAGKLTVEGVANVFEANVSWEIMLGGDAAIDQGYTMAAECCSLEPYSFTTNIALEPGRYTVVVHDNDESGEGRPVNQDTKEIVVE